MSDSSAHARVQRFHHALKQINDIQCLATFGEEAIVNELPIDISQYDILFSTIKTLTEQIEDDLACVEPCGGFNYE